LLPSIYDISLVNNYYATLILRTICVIAVNCPVSIVVKIVITTCLWDLTRLSLGPRRLTNAIGICAIYKAIEIIIDRVAALWTSLGTGSHAISCVFAVSRPVPIIVKLVKAACFGLLASLPTGTPYLAYTIRVCTIGLTVSVIIYAVIADLWRHLRTGYAHSLDTDLVARTGFFDIATRFTHSGKYFTRKNANLSRWAAVVGCTPGCAHICFIAKLLEWTVCVLSTSRHADERFKFAYRLTDFSRWAVFVRAAYGYTHPYVIHKYTNFSLGAVFTRSTPRYADI
jgi:hypothetical protein